MKIQLNIQMEATAYDNDISKGVIIRDNMDASLISSMTVRELGILHQDVEQTALAFVNKSVSAMLYDYPDADKSDDLASIEAPVDETLSSQNDEVSSDDFYDDFIAWIRSKQLTVDTVVIDLDDAIAKYPQAPVAVLMGYFTKAVLSNTPIVSPTYIINPKTPIMEEGNSSPVENDNVVEDRFDDIMRHFRTWAARKYGRTWDLDALLSGFGKYCENTHSAPILTPTLLMEFAKKALELGHLHRAVPEGDLKVDEKVNVTPSTVMFLEWINSNGKPFTTDDVVKHLYISDDNARSCIQQFRRKGLITYHSRGRVNQYIRSDRPTRTHDSDLLEQAYVKFCNWLRSRRGTFIEGHVSDLLGDSKIATQILARARNHGIVTIVPRDGYMAYCRA